MRTPLIATILTLTWVLVGCESGPIDGPYDSDAAVGSATSELSRCAGGTNGDMDYCAPSCRCDYGEGDCDGNSTCNDGLVCAVNAGPLYGLPSGRDVCTFPECANRVWDVGECGRDCGGTSACPDCTVVRLTKTCGGTNGGRDFCTNPNEPCLHGEGDCDSNAECAPGLVCAVGAGPQFGLAVSVDVCVNPECNNRVWDVDECGVDCGGTSGCATCAPERLSKGCNGANGGADFCINPNQPCGIGEGDCDSNAECAPGLVCHVNAGPKFGLPLVDACAPSHCFNGSLDGDETALDCGGSCGFCNGGGATEWALSTGSTGNDEGRAVVADAAGNVYLTGSFRDTIDLGGGPLVSAGARDIFVASFDSTGAHRWSLRAGDIRDSQIGLGIAIDSAANVIVVGYFVGTINLGGSDLVTSTSQQSVFVAKFDSSGNHLWSRQYGVEPTHEQGWDIAVDSNDDLVIAGYYRGAPDFGDGPLPATATGWNAFLLSLSDTGDVQWSRGFGSDGSNAYLRSVAVDTADNIYVSGQFDGSINFGGSTLTSAGDLDAYVASFTDGGVHRWSRRFGDANEQQARHIVVDPAGNAVVAGWFRGSMDLGCGSLNSAGDRDVFVTRLSGSTGTCIWSRRHGGSSAALADALAVDSSNRIVVGGSFEGTASFGLGNLTSSGARDVFVYALNAAGSTLWSRRYGNANSQFTGSLALQPSGSVVMTGWFEGSMTFGGTLLSSAGGTDIWLASVSP